MWSGGRAFGRAVGWLNTGPSHHQHGRHHHHYQCHRPSLPLSFARVSFYFGRRVGGLIQRSAGGGTSLTYLSPCLKYFSHFFFLLLLGLMGAVNPRNML